MQRYISNVQDTLGNAVPGVTVTVRIAGTAQLAAIFSDNGVTPKSNPFTNDSDGEFSFYAGNGRYDIQLSGPVSETQADILLFDAASAGLVTASFIVDADADVQTGANYFVDVTSGAVTLTLPAAPTLQDAPVVITHYAGDVVTNPITIARNGNNIMGSAQDLVLNSPNGSLQLKYSDAAGGWRIAGDSFVSGAVPSGTVDGSLLKWDTTTAQWLEDTRARLTDAGALALPGLDVGVQDFGVADGVVASAAGVLTIDYAVAQSIRVVLTENITSIVVNNSPPSGALAQIEIELVQDSTTAYTVDFSNLGPTYPDSTAPNFSTLDSEHLIHLRSRDAFTNTKVSFASNFG